MTAIASRSGRSIRGGVAGVRDVKFSLANPEEKHWMMAGPEGAIVSEYASAQDMDGLRFTHPDITL